MIQKTKVVIAINPPPKDGRCECCGRRKSELKPFGASGDPLYGDFTGAYLVKTFRDVGNTGCVGASWECRDCIILSDKEYQEKLRGATNESRSNGN